MGDIPILQVEKNVEKTACSALHKRWQGQDSNPGLAHSHTWADFPGSLVTPSLRIRQAVDVA